MVLIADLILIIIALIALLIASICDLKTREVPDWISYGLIISAFAIRLMYSIISTSWPYFFYGIAGFLVMLVIGNIMFRAKQWGGGDTKLIMGLGIIFATKPYFIKESFIPFIMIILINILIVGAIYGIIYGMFLAFKHKKKFLATSKKLMLNKRIIKIRIYMLIIAIPFLLSSFIIKNKITKTSILIIALIIVIYPYLWTFIKAIEKACLYKYLSPKNLTEGDWVEEDIKIKNKIIYKKKNIGIEKKDIQKLIKARIKKVLVKEGIPFIPPFFIGTLISVIYGNIIFLF